MAVLKLTDQPPLVQAIFSGDPEEIRMLIHKTEDVNALDSEKRTPLHVAAFLGDAEIIELLILSGARVNAKDNMWLTPLHRAVASRSEEAVQVLIKHSADVNARDKNWQTPLHVAAANKAVKCAEVIIPLLSSVNVSDRGGRTALHHAALNGHVEMVNLLLAKGANINAFDKKDRRALHWAAYMGHLDVVALLVNHGAEVTCKDKKGYTPLHAAASNGQINVVKHLLNLGVEIDEINVYGNTALHLACYNGQDAVVNELTDYGANVNQPNNSGFTPLHFAAASTHGALCLELLVNNGADVNIQSKDGKSPLHMTAVHGRFTRSQTLIQNGGEIDCVDKDGNTPLHVAARYGHELLINTLITSGADTAKCGIHSMFPLHLAALNAHSDCCRKLLSSGFEIDTPDKFGRTCLHAAAAGGNVECIKLLQSSGADFHKKDKCGRTPLHYAAANCHFHCIETLVTTGASVNETDDWGRTALHYAAASDMDRNKIILGNAHENSEELERARELKEKEAALCLEFLLQHDANPSIRDKEGYNSIHYAAAYGHRQCLELLLERTNSVFEESDSGATKSPLHLAAYNGHHQALEVLLQSLVDLDIRDEKGRTALDLAAFKGHTECVEALINQGASIFVKDNVTKRTPLHASVINGHTLCMRLLLEIADNPEVVDVKDAKGQTPLMLAVAYGHSDAVSLLLEKEANVDAVDIMGCTALHRGIMTGHEECVQMLLEQEVSILCKDSRGRTPLHYAAARGHATWLSELLQMALSEEDCSFKDNQGYTPLHWACYNGNENCIEVLLEQKCFRTFIGNPFTPLHCAIINDHENCASLLLGAIDSSIVNCRDDKGRTPLHAAAFADHVECLQLLLRHNAQVNAADNSGKTPLMMAAENGQAGAVDILVNSAQADLTVKDKDLNTSLHLASSKGHEKCALLILDKIQDESLINAKNNALQTPLHVAARNGLKVVVEELLAKGACVLAVDENDCLEGPILAPVRRKEDSSSIHIAIRKIELPKKLAKRYPAYELYLYGEGSYAEEHKVLPLTGIPVLFLPGNAGSYKQVRSIGSIALRKAEDIDFKYHFDFFSVNFNEELVALYGGSLQKQTKFVHECIKTILKLYKGQEFAPKSVAIVGHSMGGLVARALLTLKNFKQDLINLLVTQATPHVAPVMPLDRFITDFYMTVNNYWILNARQINLTTLSVAGGFRDYQVRSGLTFLPKLSHHTSALSVVSSAVPKTWVSTDHLSIVWCKQLQLTTVRAFFDLIDADTKQITQNPKKKLSVLNHHFIRHPAKHFEENPSIISDLTGTSMWVPVKVSKWTYVAYNESDKIYFTFPLANHRKIYTHVYCQSTMLDTNSWIFGCINSTSMCRQGVDLSWKAELLPTIKSLTLRLQDYPSLSHLVVYVPSIHGSKFVVDCEFFKKETRSIQLPVTHLFSFGLSSRKVILNTSGLFYNIELLNFGQIYQAFKINVVSKCSGVKEEITSIYKLHIPWSYEDSLTIAQVPSSTEISVKLHIAQPDNDSHVALLKMYTSSDCQYEVTVKTSFSQILGQVVRFHGGALPAYVISSILLAYGGQLYSLFSTGHCLEYATMLDKEAKPYKVDPFVIMVKFLLGYKWFKELWDMLLLPELDAIILTSQSMCFPLVSLILFLFGTCTAYWGGLLSSTSVKLLSSLWLALKRPSELPKDIKIISPDLPILTIIFILISWTTCGAFAILLTYLYYVFKIVHLQASLTTFKNSQTVNPKHSRRSEKKSNHHKDSAVHHLRLSSSDAEDSLRMHSTLINLLTWIVLLSMPSLIYWLKNLRYYFKLNPDPCKPLAFILIPTMAILGNTYTTSIKSSKLLKTTSQFPLPLAVGVIAFGSSHLYRVPCFVFIPLLLHALCNFM